MEERPVTLRAWEAASGFIAGLLVGPAIASVLLHFVHLPKIAAGTVLVLFQLATALGFLCLLGHSPLALLFGTLPRRFTAVLCESARGALAWTVALPAVLVTSVALGHLLLYLWNVPPSEQSIVQTLRSATDTPYAFAGYAMLIIILIPVTEEILFRGFVHSWLRTRLPASATVLCSSALFSAAHFSPSMGVGNIQLLGSLFVLSLFLGYLCERYQSLFAPIALHTCFNLGTVLMIFLGATP